MLLIFYVLFLKNFTLFFIFIFCFLFFVFCFLGSCSTAQTLLSLSWNCLDWRKTHGQDIFGNPHSGLLNALVNGFEYIYNSCSSTRKWLVLTMQVIQSVKARKKHKSLMNAITKWQKWFNIPDHASNISNCKGKEEA